jgi:Domain of unknown function (DUF389)
MRTVTMPTLHVDEVARMRDSVLFDGDDAAKRVSRFWILLVLASIIASAGVVADSTATVIGAMIVAPLMLPIQGTMLSVVLADRKNLLRSLGLVVGGALAAILIGWLIGLLVVNDVVAANNSQVAGRVWWAPSPSFAATSPTPCPVWRLRSHWCRPSRWSV